MSRRRSLILCLWFLAAPLAASQPPLPFQPGENVCKAAPAFPPKGEGKTKCHPKIVPPPISVSNAQPPGHGHAPRVRRVPRTLKMAGGFRASGRVPVKSMKVDFEQIYGHTLYSEQALKGAVPVQACPSGGYISAGFTRRTDLRTDADVYVVRLAENGTALWERTFDFGEHLDDVGTSVREVYHGGGNGFIVTGTTAAEKDVDRDIFLLRLDCNGDLSWLQVLQTWADLEGFPTDDVANDVMEAETGAIVPVGQPRQGDLVVAGFSRRQDSDAFDTDAYLVRTDFMGTVIWSQTYANWGENETNPYAREWFNALSEAQPVDDQKVGDVLAAGAQADEDWKDGLAVRVSGVTGGFTAPLHIMANFNVPDLSGPKERLTELWAIRELHQAGGENLNIVVVGNIAAAGNPTEGYAAKTDPKLNNILAERVIGDGFAGPGDEGFADFQEIVAPTSYGSAGNLVVAGYATISGGQDMSLLALGAASLAPVSLTGRLFGDHSSGEERATALSQVLADTEKLRSAGFYVNGFNRSDPVLVTDPEDMFLIKTDAWGETACSIGWSPGDIEPEPEVCYAEEHVEDPWTVNMEWPGDQDAPSWGADTCP